MSFSTLSGNESEMIWRCVGYNLETGQGLEGRETSALEGSSCARRALVGCKLRRSNVSNLDLTTAPAALPSNATSAKEQVMWLKDPARAMIQPNLVAIPLFRGMKVCGFQDAC